jgi:ubiquinone/menaquinone biosynthesis C-methylase UbiE
MVAAFYDELAPDYHLIYGNWEHAIAKQGRRWRVFSRNLKFGPAEAVLDAACGIGTQTIGLLSHNYQRHRIRHFPGRDRAPQD